MDNDKDYGMGLIRAAVDQPSRTDVSRAAFAFAAGEIVEAMKADPGLSLDVIDKFLKRPSGYTENLLRWYHDGAHGHPYEEN